MIISLKDIFKMAGILIVSFCAVFVCTLFLNYYLDLITIEDTISDGMVRIFYDAQCGAAKLVSIVSGGCLLLTTVILLCFYIGHYIDTHKKQLGILKALGYARFSIAKNFWVFGLCVFAGTGIGYGGAHLLMPNFYKMQDADGFFPDLNLAFHPGLFCSLVILPTLFFALLAILYSNHRLKVSALSLMREHNTSKVVKAKKDKDRPFLSELKWSNVRQRKSLVFFITFAVFCFSSMMQMACTMDEYSSQMMSVMMMLIGILLACVTLFIATTSVISSNGKTITMMKVFGYEAGDCAKAVLGGYRPWAYLGFLTGTVYQYFLLKVMIEVVFADFEGIPEYQFDVPVMLLAFFVFILLYESVMFLYTKRMEKSSIKEIMQD